MCPRKPLFVIVFSNDGYVTMVVTFDFKNINTFNFAKDGVQMNPGLAALWEEEIERRKIKNMNLDNINPPPSQPRPDAVPTSSHVFYKTNLSKRLHDCTAEMVTLYSFKNPYFNDNVSSFCLGKCLVIILRSKRAVGNQFSN